MLLLREITQTIENEDLTAQIDGVVTIFTSVNNFKAGTLVAHLSGLQQQEGSAPSGDYLEIDDNQFQFNKAPKIGMKLAVSYEIQL